jgi:hypothetical protein
VVSARRSTCLRLRRACCKPAAETQPGPVPGGHGHPFEQDPVGDLFAPAAAAPVLPAGQPHLLQHHEAHSRSRGQQPRGPLRSPSSWRPATACFPVAAITSEGVRGRCCSCSRSLRSSARARRCRAAPAEVRSGRWPATCHVPTSMTGAACVSEFAVGSADFDFRCGWAPS